MKKNKLYKNKKQGMLFGVAAGIGTYLGWDGSWVRMLWVLLTVYFICSWISVIAIALYVALVIILAPQPKDTTTKHTPKPLFRLLHVRMLSGVSSGLATCLGTEPVTLRIFFTLITLISPVTGISTYLIAWYIIPPLQKRKQRKNRL